MSKQNSEDQLDQEQLAEIASVFKCLSDPTRLAVLQSLKTGAKNVTDLTTEVGTSHANVSKHLRLLLDSGLVTREPRKNQVFYTMHSESVMPLCELVCGHINNRHRSHTEIEFAI